MAGRLPAASAPSEKDKWSTREWSTCWSCGASWPARCWSRRRLLRIDAPKCGRHVARRLSKTVRRLHKMTEQIAARRDMANAIRALAMDAVQQADSGHPGMPMGMADVATVLFTRFLKFDASEPHWPDRDRFILSAGHGSMLLYALLYLTGYADMTLDELKRFRQLGSRTAGHPEYGHASGIETTTGPLGQGISNSVGLALAERMLAARFNRPDHEIVDHHTYTIASDGDLQEGIAPESCSLAGHLKLGRLIAFYDDNHIQLDGDTAMAFSEDVPKRFEAYGWHVLNLGEEVEPERIESAVQEAKDVVGQPTLIVIRPEIGYGGPGK